VTDEQEFHVRPVKTAAMWKSTRQTNPLLIGGTDMTEMWQMKFVERDMVHFNCPACGMRLSVSQQVAGAKGPCPSCGHAIHAPMPGLRPQRESAPRPVLKPEPQALSDKSTGIDTLRAIPHAGDAPVAVVHRLRKTSRTAGLLRRTLMAALFLVAAGATVFGVLTLLKRETPGPLASLPEEKPVKSAAVAEPKIDDAPAPNDALEPIAPRRDAEAALEKFLAAPDLASRMPLMETEASQAELAASCLAKTLPAVVSMVRSLRETDAIENRVDYFYKVEFQTSDPQTRMQTILVRTRGGDPPKIAADAFLDTYGGRLAAYAAKPSDKAGFFSAVVHPVAGSADADIPNPEEKQLLILMACDNAPEIASAYFNTHSKIAEILKDRNRELTYGSARPCTVMLRWNTEEDPGRPFLEAIAIKDYGWSS
jgi:predicted RNA-binding Zn-ribbon protein involved in translation (DUF1610 family)